MQANGSVRTERRRKERTRVGSQEKEAMGRTEEPRIQLLKFKGRTWTYFTGPGPPRAALT